MTRSRTRSLLFSALAALLVLGALEGGARLLERSSDVLLGPFEIDVVPDVLGFEPHHPVGHLDLDTFANVGGYNGIYHPPERRPDTLRVAVLGDSFTFGWGVPAEQAWPALLEERLDAELARAGIDAEVLNFGVPGYNTWLELLHWRRVVSRYAPDVVLLGYYSNDAVIDRRVPNVYALCPEPPPKGPARVAAVMERSALARVMHDLYWVARVGSPLPPWDGKDVLGEEHYGFRCSMEWAKSLARDVESTGARFAVVQLPHMDGLADPYDPEGAAHERLRQGLVDRGLTTDSLYPRLAGQDGAALSNADAHPNAAGNRAILDALWPVTGQWLLARGLAQASRGDAANGASP